ncbi:MAG: outer membrane lipoprotein chaperone LolA, partial [Deltaproteobacteria bacterium]|nr:outer membrane lipoprotein chaperone LolA [Deltaproteobacteria bacterium]
GEAENGRSGEWENFHRFTVSPIPRFINKEPIHRFITIFLLATGYWLLATVSWSEDLDGIISRLQKTYEGLSDIKANFSQETTSTTLKETQRSEGIVYLKRSGMMRWEYKAPQKDVIVSDGDTLWVYQPDLGQVIVGRMVEGRGLVSNFLSGSLNLKEEFSITLEGDKGDTCILNLVPKIPQHNVKRIRIVVDKKTFLMTGVTVYDLLGNITTMSLKEIKTNQSLSPKLFHFDIPEGVKVIKE